MSEHMEGEYIKAMRPYCIHIWTVAIVGGSLGTFEANTYNEPRSGLLLIIKDSILILVHMHVVRKYRLSR